MNEQILDICIKAGINTWPFNEVGFISLDESELVKFAELIVKECADIAQEHNKSPVKSIYAVGHVIREHFGVEE